MSAAPGACPHGGFALLSTELRRDLSRHIDASDHRALRRRAGWIETLSALLTPHLMAVVLYRLSHLAHARGWICAGKLAWWLNHLLHKTSLSPESCIGGGLFLPHPLGICFHGRARGDLTLFSHALCAPASTGCDGDLSAAPLLGDGVTIGVLGAVLGPVLVGPGARVAPRTTLLRDLPAGAVAVSRALRVRTRALPRAAADDSATTASSGDGSSSGTASPDGIGTS